MTVRKLMGEKRVRVLAAILAGSTALVTMTPVAMAQATGAGQSQQPMAVSIRSGGLDQALLKLAREANLQLVYPSQLTRGKTTKGASGQLTAQAALGQILMGTGLQFQFTGPRSVEIFDPAVDLSGAEAAAGAAGTVLLDPIMVRQGQGGLTPYSAYETPAPLAHIEAETVDRYPGTDAADLFRGVPGVGSGDARNAAGAVDVNIRGMQGMGRVEVTVDGTSNGIEVGQGYQGMSSRNFIDTDFVAGVDITKGADMASSGTAGNVALRTLEAGDIVKEGKSFGLRLRGGFSTNSTDPRAGSKAGYEFRNDYWAADTTPIESPDGMNRPSLLKPAGGNGSAVLAYEGDQLELLLGYAYRQRGNYHAGTNGPHADPVNTGAREICNYGHCNTVQNFWETGGLANYRAGEEVLNTAMETESILAKAKWKFSDSQSIKLTYRGYIGESGDAPSWFMQNNTSQGLQNDWKVRNRLHDASVQYRWKPTDNGLIDLTANLWGARLERSQPYFRAFVFPGQPLPDGHPDEVQVNKRWGADVSNTALMSTALGDLRLDSGLSFNAQDNRPAEDANSQKSPGSSFGSKREFAAYAKGELELTDALSLRAGLRYLSYETSDKRPESASTFVQAWPDRKNSGWGYSLGVSYDVRENTTVYANYANALRSPSIGESTSSGPAGLAAQNDVNGERNKNWELGVNHRHDGLFTAGDRAYVKLGYFRSVVDGYVAREYGNLPGTNYTGLYLSNLDEAKFEGLELSARYELAGLTADLAANYYTDVSFCKVGEACQNATLYGDYATNQIPPEYMISFGLSKKLMDDRLTVGGRVQHVGPRAAGHGAVTGQGMALFISEIKWEPFTTVDAFAEYDFNDTFKGRLSIENLTDTYYVDPLGSMQQPGPGRTINVSLTAHF